MSETKPKNLQDYLMEHGILKNADAEKMAREITEMFESKTADKIERLRDEITRLKSVVGEVDIELIDQTLEETK